MRQLIAGNWKMHGLMASLEEIRALTSVCKEHPQPADVLVCPPFTLVARAVTETHGRFAIGGQDCHAGISGAFTGDVSAEMLKDAGASAVIVGHSERRQTYGETDAIVASKALAAWRAGLHAIICIGENEDERSAGDALIVCGEQLEASVPAGATAENTVLAYEPCWAIGTGKTPTMEEITEVHALIRSRLTDRFGSEGEAMLVLYGGSVKPGNAKEILAIPEVGGALVGGASLKAVEFLQIIGSARSN